MIITIVRIIFRAWLRAKLRGPILENKEKFKDCDDYFETAYNEAYNQYNKALTFIQYLIDVADYSICWINRCNTDIFGKFTSLLPLDFQGTDLVVTVKDRIDNYTIKFDDEFYPDFLKEYPISFIAPFIGSWNKSI